MRTKLDAVRQTEGAAGSQASDGDLLAELSLHLSVPRDRLAVVSGGTAARTVIARGNDETRFLKTYDHPNGERRLRQEASLLAAAYPDMLAVRILDIPTRSGSHPWLAMAELVPPAHALDPETVLRVIADYQPRVNAPTARHGLAREISLATMLAFAGSATDELERRAELDTGAAADVRAALSMVKARLPTLSPIICHGDLSPRNIMANRDGELYAIDWEDALWAVQGYDYLYWLTFFQNRRFYHSAGAFGVTGLGRDIEIALMISVVLIKGYIAALNGTNATNSLRLSQRIAEISAL